MMKNIIVMLSIFLIYLFVQVDGKICPNSLKPMTDLEPDKVMGLWYVIEHTKNNITNHMKCYNFISTQIDKDKYMATCSGITIDGKKRVTTQTFARFVGNPKKGRVLARTVHGENEDIYYANLLTDYDTIQLIYGCDTEDKTEHSWITARERNPGEDFFEKAHKLLRDNGLDPADYTRANQENCP